MEIALKTEGAISYTEALNMSAKEHEIFGKVYTKYIEEVKKSIKKKAP